MQWQGWLFSSDLPDPDPDRTARVSGDPFHAPDGGGQRDEAPQGPDRVTDRGREYGNGSCPSSQQKACPVSPQIPEGGITGHRYKYLGRCDKDRNLTGV